MARRLLRATPNYRSKLVASERLSNEGQRVMWSDGWPVWSNHIHRSSVSVRCVRTESTAVYCVKVITAHALKLLQEM